jgi:hypothetical protein
VESLTGKGNVISGNGANGVWIHDPGAIGNLIAGNYIGVNPKVTAALPNAGDGVLIDGVANNMVGGLKSSLRNIIAGNSGNPLI